MPTEHRKQWLAALRNPENKQAKACLKSVSGAMCCLGVGLVVAGVEHELSPSGSKYCFNTLDDRDFWVSVMPSEKQRIDILGLSEEEGELLAFWNDGGKVTFAEIADFLETGKMTNTMIEEVNDQPTLSEAAENYKPQE